MMVAVAQQQSGEELVAAGRDTSTMVSRDGGNTWTTVRLPGYTAGAFDPMVVVGPDGRFYVMQCVIAGAFAREINRPEARTNIPRRRLRSRRQARLSSTR